MAKKKATFSLSPDLLDALEAAVTRGAAPSKNALVERALTVELEQFRRQIRRSAWMEASKDPLFLKDIANIEKDFRRADAETAEAIV